MRQHRAAAAAGVGGDCLIKLFGKTIPVPDVHKVGADAVLLLCSCSCLIGTRESLGAMILGHGAIGTVCPSSVRNFV